MGERDDTAESVVESTARDVLQCHPVRLAILFGSRSRGRSTDHSDVDIAVEFEEFRPADPEYSDVYLSLLDDLESALSSDVDLVDVHSVPSRFAREVFDHGTLLVGAPSRRDELETELAGEPISRERAYERIDAAVQRMNAGRSSN